MKSCRALTAVFLLALTSPLAGQITLGEYAARRDALASRLGDGVVVAFGGREPVRHWPPFFQLPAFRYLTGFLESDAAFVMATEGGNATSTLFVARPNARTALYNGERVTPETVRESTGLAAGTLTSCRPSWTLSSRPGFPSIRWAISSRTSSARATP